MAKRPQGWVQCEDQHLPYYKDNANDILLGCSTCGSALESPHAPPQLQCVLVPVALAAYM
jgi:hypothetical protein